MFKVDLTRQQYKLLKSVDNVTGHWNRQSGTITVTYDELMKDGNYIGNDPVNVEAYIFHMLDDLHGSKLLVARNLYKLFHNARLGL